MKKESPKGRKRTRRTTKKRKKNVKKVSYHRKPEEMDLRAWQIELRRQYGQKQEFIIENTGNHPVYSEFKVANPEAKTAYKVAIRGQKPGNNFCSCPDFKSNTLGTCKHIEAAIHKIFKTRGMRKHFKQPYEAAYSSVYLYYGEEREIRLRIGTEATEVMQALAKGFFDENNALKPDAYGRFEQFLEKARQLQPSFRCYPDALDFILQKREDERRRQRVAAIARQKNKYLDQLLKIKLFPYQKDGVLFAAQAGRCLLADEMGLGKTVQAIGAAELLKKEFNIARVLIICPTSLKYQWKSEIEKFTDSTVEVIEGTPAKRKPRYEESESFYQIVSYHMASNDLEEVRASEPDLVILDEAQRIKNWNTKISRAIKQLDTPYAIVLTGTPLENKLEELYSITQFVDNYILGPVYLFLNRHQIKSETGQVVGYKDLGQIKEKLAEVMIRRTKKTVLKQLPGRMDKNLFVPMTDKQMDMHKEFSDVVARLVAKWRRYGFLREKDRQRLLINLNQMRMVCDSTYILDQKTRHDTKVLELMCILEEALAEDDTKVVVFSQWQRMTHLVAQELEEREIPFCHLHGGVPGSKRGELLDRFREDDQCKVFLSTDAGGVGLNLQTASIIINLDLPWNPAVLEQRIGRVYRMGQLRKVNVVNFVSAGTIEHRMLHTLEFKASMAAGVLDDGEDFIFMGGERFKKFMQNVEEIAEAKPTEVGEAAAVTSDEDLEPAAIGESAPPAEFETLEATEEMQKEGQEAESAPEPSGQRNERGTGARGNGSGKRADSPGELVQMGMSFFASLTQTLSDEKKTRELTQTLVKKDKNTGQTYLHIPVENEEIVQNAFNLLGSLVRQFGK